MDDTASLVGDGSSSCKPARLVLLIFLQLTTSSEGVTTVGCGIISAMMMPEYPHNARLLQPVERDYAVWRLEMEAGAGEAHEETTTWGGLKLALLDPKVWAIVWCMGMSQAMGTIVNFFP